ncbi:hypothetical protein B0O80DRAFT_448393 [Mortierella sp. GBAus27b]|nr:hypothetical protein B0O80DRAFT_448393 [Mortierella sp. GBAus27b]
MQSSQTTPLPALRIHVDDMTLETFQIVLQFIYTGQIGLSEQLLQDIKMYWGENQDNTAPSEIPPPPAETSQEQRHEPRWPSGGGGGLPFATCAANDDHDDDRETTSWETLLEAAQRFGLGELKYRAMKAVQYHRQMLALRDRVSRHTVAEGSSHDGFGGPALDLQLALGEQILRSMLSLHQCPRLKEREDGRVEVMTAEEEEEEEGEEKGSRSTRTRVGLTREQQQQHQGEDGESCVRPGGDDAEVEAMDESSPSSCTRVGMQGEWRAEGNTAGAEREEEREDGEEGSQVCDDASWSRRVHVEKEVGKKDLFQDPECEEALLELCSNLRERFFVMHRIMHTCND